MAKITDGFRFDTVEVEIMHVLTERVKEKLYERRDELKELACKEINEIYDEEAAKISVRLLKMVRFSNPYGDCLQIEIIKTERKANG